MKIEDTKSAIKAVAEAIKERNELASSIKDDGQVASDLRKCSVNGTSLNSSSWV